jgi:very-short-patch-repair endonuclease
MEQELPTRIVRLAEAQHGVVARAQLLGLGIPASTIDSRMQRGALRRLYRGVYALAHLALRDEAHWLAAVLACGAEAVLSHTSAARLWRMASVPVDPTVHVTVPHGDRRPPGLTVHRAALTRVDVTVHRGVPTTTPARTIVDLAAVVPYRTLRAIADHGVRLDAGAVRRAAARSPNRRGRAALARLVGDDGSTLRSRSGLERQLRQLALGAGLPAPLVNHRIAGDEHDFAWPNHRLVVEVDGHAYHAPRGARERDHERDVRLVLAGWRVLRFTDTQLDRDHERVVAGERAAIGDPSG